jgi:replicative DNA helicase
MTNGWQPADLIVLAARTSVGKTAFGCELALNALKNGNKVLFFSLEMKAEAVMQRLVSNLSEVPLGYIVDKTAVQKDVDSYRQAMHWMRGKDFWIDDRGMINSAQVRAKARKFARKGLDMIVVDYAQKMSALDPRIPREQQVAEIAGSMKNLAMELNIPVILLSQLNRGADELNRKPRLSDMRESGALEQDADLCALLWRKNDDPDETIISISKQRNGRCGDVEVCFKPKIQKFTPRPILS